MIRIYGASDDLVEIEGHPDGDEINGVGADIQVGDENFGGVLVSMRYGGVGLWAAGISQIEEGVPIPFPVAIKHQREDGYSVLVEIDAPEGVALEWKVIE